MEKKRNTDTIELIRIFYNSGLPIKDFAKKLNVPYSTVCRWLRGENSFPPYLLDLTKNKFGTENE